jgi:hypothetical protein
LNKNQREFLQMACSLRRLILPETFVLLNNNRLGIISKTFKPRLLSSTMLANLFLRFPSYYIPEATTIFLGDLYDFIANARMLKQFIY